MATLRLVMRGSTVYRGKQGGLSAECVEDDIGAKCRGRVEQTRHKNQARTPGSIRAPSSRSTHALEALSPAGERAKGHRCSFDVGLL